MIINYETAFENNFINSTPSAQRNELDIINSDMDRKKAKKVQEAARARKSGRVKRLTAKQVLANPWVQSEAPATSLAGSQKALKKYMANQRLRKAALGEQHAHTLESAE